MRKKYFLYELKTSIPRMAIFSVFASAIFMISIFRNRSHISGLLHSPGIESLAVIIVVLAIVMPIIYFSFTKQKRGVDEFYSLPISKMNFNFVRLLVGLINIIVPYTISFLFGMLIIVFSNPGFYIGYYFLYYICSLLIGICIYFFTAFAYNQGNSIVDGLIITGMSFLVFVVFVSMFFVGIPTQYNPLSLTPLYSVMHLTQSFIQLISRGTINFSTNTPSLLYENFINPLSSYIFTFLTGGLALWGIYMQTQNNNAEVAESYSTSWFGYKIQIPLFTISLLVLCFYVGEITLIVIVMIISIIMTMVEKRTYKLTYKSWAYLGGYFVVSMIIRLLFSLLFH